MASSACKRWTETRRPQAITRRHGSGLPDQRTSLLFARIKFEGRNSRTPIEAAACEVVLLRVPQRATILRVDGHAAVVPPAVKAALLHAGSDSNGHRPSQIAGRVCGRAPDDL